MLDVAGRWWAGGLVGWWVVRWCACAIFKNLNDFDRKTGKLFKTFESVVGTGPKVDPDPDPDWIFRPGPGPGLLSQRNIIIL